MLTKRKFHVWLWHFSYFFIDVCSCFILRPKDGEVIHGYPIDSSSPNLLEAAGGDSQQNPKAGVKLHWWRKQPQKSREVGAVTRKVYLGERICVVWLVKCWMLNWCALVANEWFYLVGNEEDSYNDEGGTYLNEREQWSTAHGLNLFLRNPRSTLHDLARTIMLAAWPVCKFKLFVRKHILLCWIKSCHIPPLCHWCHERDKLSTGMFFNIAWCIWLQQI